MNRGLVAVALQQFCERDDRPMRLLREAGFEVRVNTLGRRLRREEMEEHLRGADAVLAGVEPYDATLLSRLPQLRCISRCGVGTDSIDLEAARRHGVIVRTTAEEVIEPVAQLTVAMILALARHLPLFAADAQAGIWRKRTGVLLSEWTIGLIGLGRIGAVVARYLRPFGPTLMAADPHPAAGGLPEGITRCDLPRLLSSSDLVSIHASRPREQGALIGRAELSAMKRGSFLVNTARGYLVDEAALCAALESGHLAGAALDVFEEEPSTGALARFPQVLCTPHVASLTRASRAPMERRAAEQIVETLKSLRAPATTQGGVR